MFFIKNEINRNNMVILLECPVRICLAFKMLLKVGNCLLQYFIQDPLPLQRCHFVWAITVPGLVS